MYSKSDAQVTDTKSCYFIVIFEPGMCHHSYDEYDTMTICPVFCFVNNLQCKNNIYEKTQYMYNQPLNAR